MTPTQKKELIRDLSDDEINSIDWWVLEFSRDKQLPPPGAWVIWLIRSGRGFGKTRTGAEWIIRRARAGYGPIALVGQTKADVRDVMIEAYETAIIPLSPPDFVPDYQPSKRRLVWPNGVFATAFSGDEPGQLRGPQHATAWVDEFAKFKYPQETLDNLELGLRIGQDPRAIITTTPKPIPEIKALIADRKDVVDVKGSTTENMDNLPESYINRVIKRFEGTRLGGQELHGDILDDVEGALWTRDLIEKHRVRELPASGFHQIAVAVDPATSVSGETGIIAGGVAWIKGEKHLFVLEDATIQGKPSEWAEAVITLYNKLKGDVIIGEVNNGGDMIENTIRTAPGGRNTNYESVRATKGKFIRAEPVQGLYERGLIHHVGRLGDLEDQLCSWVQGDANSPDRLDALVWLATFTLIEGGAIFKDVEGLGKVEGYKSKWT